MWLPAQRGRPGLCVRDGSCFFSSPGGTLEGEASSPHFCPWKLPGALGYCYLTPHGPNLGHVPRSPLSLPGPRGPPGPAAPLCGPSGKIPPAGAQEKGLQNGLP